MPNQQLVRHTATVSSSVATLLLWKSTRFYDKKTLDSQKKHQITKANLHTVKMPRKRVAMPIIDFIVQLIANQSNACVCLYSSLKLLTDDQVTSQRFNSKYIILSCVIQDLIR